MSITSFMDHIINCAGIGELKFKQSKNIENAKLLRSGEVLLI